MTVIAVPDSRSGTGRVRIGRVLRSNPSGAVGAVLLIVVIVAGLLAPLIAPHPPEEVNFDLPFQMPGTAGYLFGTDDLGRDILSRMLYGIGVSLQVGLLAVALALLVGIPLGLAAGYFRRLDALLARVTDLMLAFPFLITAVALTAITGPSGVNAAIALGVAQVPIMARVVRAETLRLKNSDFILNARTMNASAPRIIFAHILPNASSAIIVQTTIIIPVAIIGEAILSFLGLGTQPPQPSLGIMLSDAQAYLSQSPSAAVLPGLAIAALCLGFNLVGDALSDALNRS